MVHCDEGLPEYNSITIIPPTIYLQGLAHSLAYITATKQEYNRNLPCATPAQSSTLSLSLLSSTTGGKYNILEGPKLYIGRAKTSFSTKQEVNCCRACTLPHCSPGSLHARLPSATQWQHVRLLYPDQ